METTADSKIDSGLVHFLVIQGASGPTIQKLVISRNVHGVLGDVFYHLATGYNVVFAMTMLDSLAADAWIWSKLVRKSTVVDLQQHYHEQQKERGLAFRDAGAVF